MATGTSNVLNISTAGIPNYSGTAFSAITLTNHAVLIGGAANAITSLPLTNGQIAIGSTGLDPVAATLTAGAGVSIANAAGSITIAAPGGALTWSAKTASFAAAIHNGYSVNSTVSTVTITLPTVAALGDVIEVVGLVGATQQWVMQIAGTGTMTFGSITGAATGTLTSTTPQDSARIICSVGSGTNPAWQVVYAVGNLTVA